ncbi:MULTISPECIES: MarR family transcriptional regulator [unclassified Streptomyces]|uniref:MarR family winged helix-turn-helix transcriptional regulator n=1 Tax=unclassified Streptomyces TaxID=2593676 RepID=UPI000DBA7BF6|nr:MULTISPECIES: MarR family transcriptional regulator [unclassified Streptomyces]MYT74653.1 MarR family transcriptional regulator [Streptomyces sp. SID8367]RAJ91637.1 DNA-binding MarR family transcriptional regulator [Streptomyces sp. PsTaAH-137]
MSPEHPESPESAPPVPDRLDGLPSRLLGLAALRAERVVGEKLAGADARRWHYAVLAVLAESGPASQAELSRRTRIYRSDMVAVLDELAERGHVERAPDPDDRRRNVVTLTAPGRRHLARLDRLIGEAQQELLDPLTETQRDELVRLLTRLNAGWHP